MKILVFSQYFYPENFRVNTLCRELVQRRNEVTVVTGYPQYPGGEMFDGYGFKIPYERKWNGVTVERVRVQPRGHNAVGMLRNCISYVTEANRWVRKCKEKFDAVFVFEVSPVTVGLPALTYKKKFGTPIYFNLQDLWPENVEEVLNIHFPPVIYAINRIVDRIYTNSDRILCTSKGFVQNLQLRGVDRDKLIFWPQFCAEPNFSNGGKPESYSSDHFNVVFAGNLGDAQGLDLMIEAANSLKSENICWYLVGDGRAKSRLKNLVQKYGLSEKVIFIGRLSEEEANRYIHFADCAYLSFANNRLFDMMLPAKLQSYLACGVPILAAAGGESAEVIREAQCGIAVPPELNALTDAVKQMVALEKHERGRMAAASRNYFEAHFKMDDLVSQLIELMNR